MLGVTTQKDAPGRLVPVLGLDLRAKRQLEVLGMSDSQPTTPNPLSPVPRANDVSEVIDLYLSRARQQNDPRTFEDRERILRLLSAELGHYRLAECIPGHLELWLHSKPQWQSAWTKRRVAATVQACFNWAAKLRFIPENPFKGVSHSEGERGRPMTQEEFRSLLRATDAHFRRVLIFLRYTGARPGEMAGLEWRHVHPERGAIILPPKEHKTGRKTRKPRVIVLNPVAVKLLIWIRRRLDRPEDTVFLNSRGTQWTRYNLAHRVQRLRHRCGIAKDCKLYGLRHRFATNVILAGADVSTLAQLLGHGDIRMALHYIHLGTQLDFLKAAVDKSIQRKIWDDA